MTSTPFRVSLTAADHSGISTGLVVEYSASQLHCTEILTSNHLLHNHEHGTQGHIILVCEDASLFFFSTPKNLPQSTDLPLLDHPSLLGPARRFSVTSARSALSSTSTNSLAPRLKVSSRSRIVSGVTIEPIEAPKNYVDFEDEPDRLKDILKGNAPSSRRDSIDTALERHLLSPAMSSPQESTPTSSKRGRPEPRSLLSATSSPSHTPMTPLSVPTSPKAVAHDVGSPQCLQLMCHAKLYGSPLRATVSSVRWINSEYIITLQESGTLCILSVPDGLSHFTTTADSNGLQPPEGMSGRPTDAGIWIWKNLLVVSDNESQYVLISASLDENTTSTPFLDTTNTETLDLSRVVLFEVIMNDFSKGVGPSLEKVGEWSCRGLAESITLFRERAAVLIFAYISADGYLYTHRLHVLARGWQQVSDVAVQEVHGAVNISAQAISNALKAMKPRLVDETIQKAPVLPLSRVTLDVAQKVGQLEVKEPIAGIVTISTQEGGLRGLIWTSAILLAFECQGAALQTFFNKSLEGISKVSWISETSYCVFRDEAETFELEAVDANGDLLSPTTPITIADRVQPRSLASFNLDHVQSCQLPSVSELLAVTVDREGQRNIELMVAQSDAPTLNSSLWIGKKWAPSSSPLLTTILPWGVDDFVLGYSHGKLKRVTLAQLCGNEPSASPHRHSDVSIGCAVASLFSIQNIRTREWFVMGGGDDGSIAIWHNTTLSLAARWTTFLYPLNAVYPITERSGTLKDCVFCVSQDGTIAAVELDGFQILYLIPASTSPLHSIHLGGENLMLAYEDGRSRLWDVNTREFWRSMSDEKAEEMLTQGNWSPLIQSTESTTSLIHGPAVGSAFSIDLDSTIFLDLERFIADTTMTMKAISTSRHETRIILDALDRLRTLLSPMLTPGLNDGIDELCTTKLGIRSSHGFVGLKSSSASSVYNLRGLQDAWTMSGSVTAARALSIVTLLRAMSLFEELAESANAVIVFYATCLRASVGPLFEPPDLAFLAKQWFSSSNEVRQAARTLLDSSISSLSDEEAIAVAEKWQHHLPTLQPTAERESITAALALFLTGYIASDKYALLSVHALTDISKSVTLYLHDEQSIYRALAIDLCSRGFHVWQHYVDCMDILRALFTLATTTKKEAISSQNVGSQARLAILHIASSNTTLFMTTLGLDILHPQSLEHRRSVMQIVAFLIRKRPLVLYPNLPRLMEAVVKSLDPNLTSHREAIFDTAAEVIGQVVRSFPTVDFHMNSQRLAVGTSEGAAVMYDLKTGTRLYVLEGHKKKIVAVSFSPDGRRLLTLSLEESTVLVWKVGTSFSSFFTPGAPPRQGHGASSSGPFKTYPFTLGYSAEMSITDTFVAIKFEWVSDRSVKLKIKESTLTFST